MSAQAFQALRAPTQTKTPAPRSAAIGETTRSALRTVIANLVVAFAYVMGAQLGFHLAFLNSQVSPVWPPEGIALAAVLILGPRAIEGVFVGAVMANYLHNPHWPTAVLIGIGNTLSVVIAARVMRCIGGREHIFQQPVQVLKFMTVGAMPGAAVSACIGVTSLYLFHFVPASVYPSVLLTWWTGEMQGLLIVAPFILGLHQAARLRWTGHRVVEAGVLLLALSVSTTIVFRLPYEVTYIPIPFILWAVFRFGFTGAMTSIVIISGVAIQHTILGMGPFAVGRNGQMSLNASLSLLELYLGALTVMTLILSATVKERENALVKQERYAHHLDEQRTAFSRFVPKQFLGILGKASAVEIAIGDARLTSMSVLFSDLRSFTSISERLTPRENIELVNDYLARMEPVINANQGFVDKFIGDAIMALFQGGSERRSADSAVCAAIHMQLELKSLNRDRVARNEIPLASGVGISTGPLVLGTVGSKNRMDTTVIGNTVNLASRLEGLTKLYRVLIVISDSTFGELSKKFQKMAREIDVVRVRGKSEPVVLYEVFAVDDDAVIRKKIELREAFTSALQLYRGAQFELASQAFAAIVSENPADSVAAIYVERCRECIEEPPSESWDGIRDIKVK
jgi:class 3 adenylate cyclase/integral membrane sensor domain MASE1